MRPVCKSTVGVPELEAPAPGILTFIPLMRYFLVGIRLNCLLSKRSATYALFK